MNERSAFLAPLIVVAMLDGSKCQEFAGSKSGGPCIVEAVCPAGRP